MARFLPLLLILLAVSLAANVWQSINALELQAANKHLEVSMADTTAERASAEKLGCSKRAQAYFTSLGFSESETAGNRIYQLQNHMNARWRSCIMQMTTITLLPGGQLTNELLIDVDERRDLGSATRLSGSAGERVTDCKLSPPDGSKRECNSQQEWRRFADAALSN